MPELAGLSELAVILESVLQAPRNKLVGRDAEFGRLLGVLESAAAGLPVVTLIGGHAPVRHTPPLLPLPRPGPRLALPAP